MKENWKSFPEFEYIEVSDLGNVRTKDRVLTTKRGVSRPRKGRTLVQVLDKKGYPMIRITSEKLNSPRVVHKLVMLTFNGPRPKGMQINHINGIKTDNRLINLEWLSASDNMKHAFRIGLNDKRGEKNGRSKITQQIADQIRALYGLGNHTQNELAEKYSVTQTIISAITKNKIWI